MLSTPRLLLTLAALVAAVQGEPAPLYIGGFIPVEGPGFPIAPVALPAVRLALELINNSSDILPDYRLQLQLYDSQHDPALGLQRFFEMVNGSHPTIFMLGPSVSSVSLHVCVAAAAWNIVQVSFSTRSSQLENRQLYPYFYRTIPSDAMLNELRHQFLREFGWSRVAVIHEKRNSGMYIAAMTPFIADLKDNGVEVLTESTLEDNNYASVLRNLKDIDARIIVANMFFLTARELFCEVYKQGLYGSKYVWILSGWAGDGWWLYDFPATHPTHNCTAQQLTAAQDGHFSVNYQATSDDTSLLGMAAQEGHFSVNDMATSDDTSLLGMTVKEFRSSVISDAGTLSEYAGYAFDAMLTIGHVLHTASRDRGLNLSEFSYRNKTFSDTFGEELLKFQKDGISGTVSFDAMGNRVDVPILEQSRGGRRRQVGRLTKDSPNIKMDINNPITWAGSKKPRDGFYRSSDARFLPVTSTVLTSVMSALGILVTFACVAFNVKFAHLRFIKLSSPNMNNVVSAGCSLGYISVIMFGIDGRQLQSQEFGVMCHARLFVLCVAYSLSFGALFFKTWRVHRIMANKRQEIINLRDRHLLTWILGLVALDTAFLCIWTAVDPFRRTVANLPPEVDPVDSDLILEPFIEKCTCEKQGYWLGAMLLYKGLLLTFGLFLAWETRRIQVPALNDSKYIGMSVYNLAVMCFVGVPVGFLIHDEYFVGIYVISSVFIIAAITSTLLFVFVPKFHALYHNPSGEVSMRGGVLPSWMRGGGGGGGGGSNDVVSFTMASSRVSPAAHNIATQHRLEKMVAERDSKISQLQRDVLNLKTASTSVSNVESM